MELNINDKSYQNFSEYLSSKEYNDYLNRKSDTVALLEADDKAIEEHVKNNIDRINKMMIMKKE